MKIFPRIFFVLPLLVMWSAGQAFFDVADTDTDKHTFEHLTEVGIMGLSQDGNFHPTAIVSKAEALAFALRAGGIAIPEEFSLENLPTDVDPNTWQAAVVARGRELGVSNPKSELFLPYQPVSKAEFLAFLFRATKVRFNPFYSETAYVAEDVAPDDWSAPHFRYAKKYGIANLTDDDQYLPYKALSRREVAVMTYRQLRLFHGDETAKKFAELQANIDQFMRYIRQDNSEKATFHLQRIVTLSHAIALQRNDKNAVAVNALSKSMKNLIVSLRAMRYGNILRAAETLHLASNHAERAAAKSEDIAPIAEQVSSIIVETLDSISRPRYASAY